MPDEIKNLKTIRRNIGFKLLPFKQYSSPYLTLVSNAHLARTLAFMFCTLGFWNENHGKESRALRGKLVKGNADQTYEMSGKALPR